MSVHMTGKTAELLGGTSPEMPGFGHIAKQMEDAYRILGPALQILIKHCETTQEGNHALRKYDEARARILKDLVR